ncbi:molybdopterin-guanine dinucleotide biosynthesis protein MobA [Mycobacterium sp. IS-1496]|uniref:nucleotidyltransferase family protein n=1 Tax=Mycobacterium sp. IS-1496 TaxID=1772284 RepID=UPI0007416C05|nr:nucleotidyltransferase family protein [Mycobacterium sp. IS-1496]KUI31192.1 molybdopterin-guanine dinucleotide biosynthesis protein MobA [Mycobacterium sp. IS-1496]
MSQSWSATGVLLAAGAGTRYGKPKVLAEEGEWLRRAVDALARGGCSDVVVVLGAAIVGVPPPARPIVAPDWVEGLSASVRAGIAAVGTAADAVVLHTVDTPDVGADVVCRVIDAARTAPGGVARAVYHGSPGHPVVVARRHWPALLASLAGDDGARWFLRQRDDVVAVECGDLATGADIDEA